MVLIYLPNREVAEPFGRTEILETVFLRHERRTRTGYEGEQARLIDTTPHMERIGGFARFVYFSFCPISHTRAARPELSSSSFRKAVSLIGGEFPR